MPCLINSFPFSFRQTPSQIFFDFKIIFSFFTIFNKHEGYFYNSKIILFVRSIHAKSIGLWWGPYIWVFSYECQLVCLMDITWSLSCYLICMWYILYSLLCTNPISWLAAKVRSHSHLIYFHIWFILLFDHFGIHWSLS